MIHMTPGIKWPRRLPAFVTSRNFRMLASSRAFSSLRFSSPSPPTSAPPPRAISSCCIRTLSSLLLAQYPLPSTRAPRASSRTSTSAETAAARRPNPFAIEVSTKPARARVKKRPPTLS